MVAYYQRLFRYDDWANREVLAALRAAGTPPDRSVRLIAHIVSAARLWLSRIEGIDQVDPVWPAWTLAHTAERWPAVAADWQRFLGSAGLEFSREVVYRNTQGETWTNAVGDILTHVINHATYHRGQIAADIRQTVGTTPPYTDYIHAARHELVG